MSKAQVNKVKKALQNMEESLEQTSRKINDSTEKLKKCKKNIKAHVQKLKDMREALIKNKLSTNMMVKEGYISRKSQIRILRDSVVIHKGQISSLKRFKEEVSEVKTGFECGVMIENYSDIKVGDIIETFDEVATSRKL